MNNANNWNWLAVHSNPISQETRCHQLAMPVVLESLFSRLVDKPTKFPISMASGGGWAAIVSLL